MAQPRKSKKPELSGLNVMYFECKKHFKFEIKLDIMNKNCWMLKYQIFEK